uniref:Fungal lipase-like domain-containing protein n=1 Tax=Oryza meridionalis TaxID=40149 RepID=A0A0E0ECB7_9ORYZ
MDLYLDLKVMVNTLPESKRSHLANKEVRNLVATIDKGTGSGYVGHGDGGSCIVWLTGHSLGASLALDVGRAMMAEQGYNLPTFLFNPPQVSLAPAIGVPLPTKKASRSIHAASSFLKAGMGKVLKPHKERMEKLFEQLSPWTPELYGHERDLICKGYISHFEQWEHVKEQFRGVGKSAMALSYRDMLFAAFGKEKERPHLLPTVRLWKNTSMDADAHDLQQWWRPDLQDIKILYNTFYNSKRCEITRKEVEGLLDGRTNSSTVWLAGHSLGASQALDVGRSMAEKGFNLPTFLFNPPQVSPAPVINLLRLNEEAKSIIYATSSLLKVGLSKIVKTHEEHMENLFEQLSQSQWTPELYVHDSDPICEGYINYFEQRQLVLERLPGIGTSAMKLSYRDMVFSALGEEKERPHLLPSVLLWKNSRMDDGAENHLSKCKLALKAHRLKKIALKAHSLEQWWKPDSELSLTKKRDVDLADRFDISGPARIYMMAENGAGSSSPMQIDWGKEEHRRCVVACLVKGVMVMTKDRSRRGRTTSRTLAPAWWESFGFRCRNVIKDEEHRRCVVACLVKGVKVMTKDRSRRGRTTSRPLAPAWWESFGFHRLDVIKDGPDEIFGAIYEYDPPADLPPRHTSPPLPRYVIAFRGTILTHLGDLIHDIKIIAKILPGSKRSRISREVVHRLHDGRAANSSIVARGTLPRCVACSGRQAVHGKERLLPPDLPLQPAAGVTSVGDQPAAPDGEGEEAPARRELPPQGRPGKIVEPHEEHMEKLFEQLSLWTPELYGARVAGAVIQWDGARWGDAE